MRYFYNFYCYYSIIIMQKHQEWLDNRTYEQHIICLTKIKENSRKSQIKSAVHCKRRKISHNKHASDDEIQLNQHKYRNKQNQPLHHSPKPNKTVTITTRQKELLWNNFLLGKRIMETNPVISTKKQEEQYQKHKKLVQWRIQRARKLTVKAGFRQTKLREYTQNNCRLSNCFRLSNTLRSRYILTLKILSLTFVRPSPNLNEIVVKMRAEGKKSIQASELVDVQILPHYQFFFKYFVHKDKNIDSKTIYLEIYEQKGLEQHLIGVMSVQRQKIQRQKLILRASVQKSNKKVGEIQAEISISRRVNLKQTL